MNRSFDRLALLDTFIRIAERGSLSAAARDLGTTQPSISRQLTALERMMNTVLAHRTTHDLTLTSDGRALLTDARRLVGEWELLLDGNQAGDDLRGEIRVVAPIALGQTLLAKAAARFLAAHPSVSLDWRLTDEPIRFGEEGCDCWFRVGDVPDQSLVVRQLAMAERVVVAAPSIDLATSTRLEDLPWLSLGPYEADDITLFDHHHNPTSFNISPRLRSNNIVSVLEAVLAGVGAAIMPHWLVADHLKKGSLIAAAPDHRASPLPINLALTAGARRPSRVDAFAKAIGSELERLL